MKRPLQPHVAPHTKNQMRVVYMMLLNKQTDESIIYINTISYHNKIFPTLESMDIVNEYLQKFMNPITAYVK